MGNILQASYIDVHEAARAGHIDEVRRWVDEGKPVDARDNTQKTPLHHAAQWGQEEALDFLIECGADVNASDFIEDTPLHLACYFGHATCARILIMVGANIGAEDCYGNTPSQIFDDHVTEPVLDEIRFIVREVIKGPLVLPEPDCLEGTDSSATHRKSLDGHRPRLESSVTASLDASPMRGTTSGGELSSDGGRLCQESSIAEERAILAPETAKHHPGHGKEGSVTRDGYAAAPMAAKRRPPSVVGEASGLSAEMGEGDRLPVFSASDKHESSSWEAGTPGQHPRRLQEPEGEGRGVAHRTSATMSNDGGRAEAVVGEESEQRCPPRASGVSGNGRPRAGALGPPLTLKLPWEEETKNQAATALSKREPTGSPASDTACSGNAGARALGSTGTAVAGLTYPGPRPLSAPLVRTSVSGARLNSMSPILSGRRFQGTSAGEGRDDGGMRDGSRSLGRTAGATLAGTLLTYATRPGGTFDVFAAARDGQVSVLKQALREGEEVDVQDDSGLTALMWAARAGRLSTAKYLVSQGASLVRRDDATGFSPMHFAAYYCRSSVVRVLVLAGADKNATDNRGKVPGECFQPMSYLSYKAFHHRRLIARFLGGDLNDGMLDKGKTMFPMNSPLEAYDEEHRPRCVRLGSNDKLGAPSDSTEQGGRVSEQGSRGPGKRSSSRAHARPRPGTSYRRASYRRASADAARKAYATMHTMASTADDGPVVRDRSVPTVEDSRSRPGGGGGGVRYYLKRGSIPQVVAKTREIISGNNAGNRESGSDSGRSRSRMRSGSSKSRSSSRSRRMSSKAGAEGGIKFYLRRASLQGLPFLENFLSGVGGTSGEGDTVPTSAAAAAAAEFTPERGSGEKRAPPEHDADREGTPAAAMACNDLAAAVVTAGAAAAAAAAAAAHPPATAVEPRTADGRREDGNIRAEGLSPLDDIEAGTRSAGSHNVGSENDRGVASEDRPSRSGECEGEAAGAGARGGGQGMRRLSARVFDMVQDNVDGLNDQQEGDRAPIDDRSALYQTSDVESGKRSVPSPSASNVESASSAASPGPEQQDASQSRSRRHRRSHHHHRHKKKTCAGVDSHGCQQARVFPDAPSSGEDDRAHRSSAERPRSEGRGRAGRKGVGGAVAPALVDSPLAAQPVRRSSTSQAATLEPTASSGNRVPDVNSEDGRSVQPFPTPADRQLCSGDSADVESTSGEPAGLVVPSGDMVPSWGAVPAGGVAPGDPAADRNRSGEELALVEEGNRMERHKPRARSVGSDEDCCPFKDRHDDLARQPLPLSAGGSPQQSPEAGSPAPAPTSALSPSAADVSPMPPEKSRDVTGSADSPDQGEGIGERTNLRPERNPSPSVDAAGTELILGQGEESAENLAAEPKATPITIPAAAVASTLAAAGSPEKRLGVLTSGDVERRHPGVDTSAEFSDTFASPPGEQGKAKGGRSRDASPERTVGSDDESSKKHGRRDTSEGRSRGRKHHHRKHKHQHRHRGDRTGDEEGGSAGGVGGGGDARNHRRRSEEHGNLGGSLVSTATMLAPLKRVPPPASAAVLRLGAEGGEPLEGPVSEGGGEGVGGG